MIGKEREKPLIIFKLETLLPRISLGLHPQREKIEEDLRKYYSGYRGEQSLEYHFNFLEDDDYIFFHGLRLPWKNDLYFQIDSLLLTPNCIIMLEVKNIKGTIYFNVPVQQMIRTLDGKEEAFPCPTIQSNRHVMHLNEWLRKSHFPNIPILAYVVFSNSSTILKTDPIHQNIFDKVLTSANMPNKINSNRQLYPNKILNKPKMEQLKNLFIQEHSENDSIVLKRYNLDRSDILNGVHCFKCNQLSVRLTKGKWICNLCKGSFPNSYIHALMDYRLHVSPSISNRQFRQFINLQSTSTASKSLSRMHLPYTGSFKDRKYLLPLDQLKRLLFID